MNHALTLKDIWAHRPCTVGWKKLLTNLGKTEADDEPLTLLDILESNGLDDALWCLRALPDTADNDVRLLVCDLVEPALKFVPKGEDRPRKAVEAARKFARGEIDPSDLAAAWAAASAARAAARAAAWAAASAAASAAEWDAASAASAAASAAEWDAASAAWDAASAAWDAAWAAARTAAWAAARGAEWDAARDAEWANARDEQERIFRAWLGEVAA